jgi:hypothetical protein
VDVGSLLPDELVDGSMLELPDGCVDGSMLELTVDSALPEGLVDGERVGLIVGSLQLVPDGFLDVESLRRTKGYGRRFTATGWTRRRWNGRATGWTPRFNARANCRFSATGGTRRRRKARANRRFTATGSGFCALSEFQRLPPKLFSESP